MKKFIIGLILCSLLFSLYVEYNGGEDNTKHTWFNQKKIFFDKKSSESAIKRISSRHEVIKAFLVELDKYIKFKHLDNSIYLVFKNENIPRILEINLQMCNYIRLSELDKSKLNYKHYSEYDELYGKTYEAIMHNSDEFTKAIHNIIEKEKSNEIW